MMPAPTQVFLQRIALGGALIACLQLGDGRLMALRDVLRAEQNGLTHALQILPALFGQFTGFLPRDAQQATGPLDRPMALT